MFIVWSELFEVGIPKIDAEHRHLASILNAFHEICEAGHGRDKVFPVLNLLVKYLEVHFRGEEALMEVGHYPHLLRQRREHGKFTESVFRLNERYEAGGEEVSLETLDFLKSWLLDHILGEDKKLEPYFRERGLPEAWRS